MEITLAENFRAVFYAPFYAAISLGWFRDSGIEIKLVESATPGSAIDQMYAQQVDLVWGGPLRAIKLRDEKAPAEHLLYAFCEVVGKDPFYVVEPVESSSTSLTDLTGKRFGIVNEVPTPWLCLQEDLRDLGLDPSAIRVSNEHSMAENLELLSSGELDAIQVFEPYASAAETRGIGKILYAAASRGLTAYTTFLSTKERISHKRAEFIAMAQVIEKFGSWLAQADPADIAQSVQTYYPSVPNDVLVNSLARYQRLGLWTCRRNISVDGFNRLAQSMYHSGFIAELPEYSECTWSV